MSAARLAIKGLACRRGGRLLFAGLDLDLTAGQSALIAGPNGIGKSSLLRIVAGLLAPFAGMIDATGAIALTDEAAALDREKTLRAALGFWAKLDNASPDRIDAALADLGIAHLADIPVRILSTGQRKRAALARTIVSGAGIWLLDEPANGLDAASTQALVQVVEHHRATGGIVLAASHMPLGWRHDAELDAGRAERGSGGMIGTLVARDLMRALRGGGLWLPLAFLLLIAALFPFAVGPDAALLSKTGGGLLWIAALLASLLPIDRLIEPDRDAGVIDQLVVRGHGEGMILLAKLVAHWLSFGPPLLIAVLPAAALLKLDSQTIFLVEAGLAVGTPGLAALALLVAALTAGLRGSGALAGLLVLPLAIPILIFGAGSLSFGGIGALKLVAACSLLLVVLCPLAGGAALRAGRD